MIQAAYEDHGKLLSTVGITPPNVLQYVTACARDWAEEVYKCYEEVIPLAPSKAYFGTPRSEGGCFKALKENICSTRKSVNHRMISDYHTRIDPPCLYLWGEPGVGKSFLTNKLTKNIESKFGLKNSVYFRNFGQQHWDGYHGQLITQFDDAFQSLDTIASPDDLVGELIVMKSNCLYQVPMAKLEEKGRNFSSEFLVMSGNLGLGRLVDKIQSINSHGAFVRRFDFSVHLKEFNWKNDTVRAVISTFKRLEMGYSGTDTCQKSFDQLHFEGSSTRFIEVLTTIMTEKHKKNVQCCLLSKGINSEKELFCSESWVIPVLKDKMDQPSFAYRFPSVPNVENVVEVHAIAEPLKVRTITKSQPIAWALKPLQKAMWKALGKFECFGLTQGKTIEEMLPMLDCQKGKLLSGDYASATDHLNSDVMQAVVGELIKVFKDHESLCHYIRWEAGRHRITYPKWTGVDDVIQTRGQLMGSLLSFPVLCVANAATVACLRRQDLHEVRCFINGDDILFRETMDRKVNAWKRITTSMGLIPSVGKCYHSAEFGSINSQLLTVKRSGKLVLQRTGRFTVCGNPQLGSLSLASEFGFSKATVVKYAKEVLKKTPQSIDVSHQWGGLGKTEDYPTMKTNTRTNREIYAFMAHKKIKSTCAPCGDGMVGVSVPSVLAKRLKGILISDVSTANRRRTFEQSLKDSLLDGSPEKDLEMTEFPWREYHSFLRLVRRNKAWREFLQGGDLTKVPPLVALKPVYQLVSCEDSEMIRGACKALFWNLVKM